MLVRIGILCAVLLIILDTATAEDKNEISKTRVKRALSDYFKHRKGVRHITIDDHHDHNDYDGGHNFFGNSYDDTHGSYDHHDDGHSDYGHSDYGHSDYGHSDYGHDVGHYDDHYDSHYDSGHSSYHDDHEGTFHEYVHSPKKSGRGYGKKRGYNVVSSKHKGYKKIYKPKVVVIQKIVPLSTTTMPTG